MDGQWLTLDQVAAHFGRDVETVRRWVRRRLLPVRRVGRVYLVEAAALDGFVPPRPRGRPRKRPPEVRPQRTVTVVWLAGGSCEGCTVAVLGASRPALETLLGGLYDLPPLRLVHPFLALETGAAYRAQLERAVAGELDPFVLVFEGSVFAEERAGDGWFARLGEHAGRAVTVRDWLLRLAPAAAAVVAIGSCATWGGVPAAAGSPTGAMGVGAVLGPRFRSRAGLPLVNVPGCAPHGEGFLETLCDLVLHLEGAIPLELDELGRPRWLYRSEAVVGPAGRSLPAERRLATVGCPVPQRGWMSGVGGCTRVGGACIGCTAPGFVDHYLPRVHALRLAAQGTAS
jgi:hydrogenase small subunit